MKLYIYVIVFVHIEWTFGIRCYSCVSDKNNQQNAVDPCLNPAEYVGDGNVNEIDCLNTKLCWKAITNGKIRRGCGEKRCTFIPDISVGSLISQTCCSSDLCNRTFIIISSKSTVFLLLLSTFCYYLFH